MKLDRPGLERLLLVACLLFALTLCLGPISNPDVPWHLAVGRRIAAEQAIPRTDFLSWTMAGRPWVDFEWLTQLLFHGLDRVGGAAGLWSLKVFMFSVLMLIVASLLAFWGLSEAWIGLGVFSCMAALRPFIEVRPENFSLIFFALQLFVLEIRRLGRMQAPDGVCLAGHAALYALWANLHAGFPVGLLLCVCYGLAERWSAEHPARPAPIAWAAAGFAGTFLNPYGPRLYSVLLDHWLHLPSMRDLINEWGVPRIGNWYQSGYWVLFLFTLAGFLASIVQGVLIPAEHVAAVVVFGLLASHSLRTTVYITLLLFPLGLLAWSRLPARDWWRRIRPGIIAVTFSIVAWNIGNTMYRDGFLRSIRAESNLEPARACAFLRSEKAVLSELRLYNPWNWGGYLDNELYPDYRVFMDGRYIFTDFLKEVAAAEKNPVRWTKFMDRYGVELALIMNVGHIVSFRGQTSWRSFDAYSMPKSDWALVYWDRQALIFVRRSKAPAAWIRRHEFHHIRPHDLRQVGLRIMSGWISFAEVSKEIDRYQREIGDPFESLVLTNWLDKFKRGLNQASAPDASGVHKQPPPNSSTAGAPRP